MRRIGETYDGTCRSSLGRPASYSNDHREYRQNAPNEPVESDVSGKPSDGSRLPRSHGPHRSSRRTHEHTSPRHCTSRKAPTKQPSPLRLDPRLVLVAAAACIVLVIGWLVVRGLDSLSQDSQDPQMPALPLPSLQTHATNADKPDETPPTSTPKEQWARGSVPLLYQTDPAWADHPYAGGTMKKDGCGPTALCMAYIAATGKTDMTPADMADWAQQHGYASAGNGSSWTLISEGAAELGLSVKEITPTPQSIKNALDAGGVVVAVVGPGDFTEVGHFLVFERMTSDGSLVVHDPNSAGHSMRSWDAQRICNQINNVWALSAS